MENPKIEIKTHRVTTNTINNQDNKQINNTMLVSTIKAGVESQCMILAAEDAAENVSVLQPEKDIAEGSKIG